VAHELGAERALGFVLVVRPAQQPDPPDAGLPASGVGLDVVELQILALLTAMTGVTHERALAAIPLPHRPPDLRGDVPAIRPGKPTATRLHGRGALALQELLLGRSQREVEHRIDIAGCHLMPEQVLDLTQQVMGLLSERGLQGEAPGRRRRHPRPGDFYPPRGG